MEDKLKQFMFMKNADQDNEKWKGPRRSTMPTKRGAPLATMAQRERTTTHVVPKKQG